MTTERELVEIKERLKDLRSDLQKTDQQHLDRYHSLKNDVAAVSLLVEAAKRADAALNEHDDRLTGIERSCGSAKDRLDSHNDRLQSLESMNIAVLADRLDRLSRQVNWIIGSFVTLILSVLTGIIVFLVSQGAA